MSSSDLTTAEETVEPATTDRLDAVMRRGLEWLEAAVDRVNPIMVKETRQALKSRQFVLTFFLVLIACWITSFAVVAIVGPEVYYVAEGPTMLSFYFGILAFPLMLIVPYTAFRSLAVEQEDNTYELLSISALSTRQIITGKLGSAVVQMLVYLSAVSPCIAFTFLLRGVDTLTVALLLFYFMLTSLGLSMMALLAGTAARARYAQVILSVVLVLIFAYFLAGAIASSTMFILESYRFIRDPWFWIVNLAFLTAYATTFALVHSAAAAHIAFNSENRSSPMRWTMLVQQACFLGWVTVMLMAEGLRIFGDAAMFTLTVSAAYWYAMGAVLTSEWPYLSRRVQRSLPKSTLGEVFLTWLNPGPGTGYMFCIANFSFVAILAWALMFAMATSSGTTTSFFTEQFYVVVCWSYLVIFLGAGKLLIGLARRFIYVSLTAGVLLHVLLMLTAIGLPQILDYLAHPQQFRVEYSLLHISNPFWTLSLLANQSPSGFGATNPITLATLLIATALVVVLLNIRATWGEIQHQRQALPTRVAEEEAELHPTPESKPQSPWES
ncbi:MAG: hypothetical protein GXP26_15375 [Planctomycetes bacterium]|nr:hypothetical protein [Planctomycetota bacterium]